nr:immunoglobulin light chain junction region [Macaca mulatta]
DYYCLVWHNNAWVF